MILPAGSQQHFVGGLVKESKYLRLPPFVSWVVYVGREVWVAATLQVCTDCWLGVGLTQARPAGNKIASKSQHWWDTCKVMYSPDVFLSTCLVEQHLAEGMNGSILRV